VENLLTPDYLRRVAWREAFLHPEPLPAKETKAAAEAPSGSAV
jgi:ribonuclease D